MKRSWKTTLAGVLGAVLFIGPQVQNCLKGNPCDWQQVAVGGVIGALGAASKDHNVSGK